MRPFFVVHITHVPRQMSPVTELSQALVTLIWLIFVVHTFDVSCQCALLTKLLQTLAASCVFFHVQGELLSHLQFGNLHLDLLVDLPPVLPEKLKLRGWVV